LDPRQLDELLHSGDDAGLYALGERVASALPPLDRWNEPSFRIDDLFPGHFGGAAGGAECQDDGAAFDAPPPNDAGGWQPTSAPAVLPPPPPPPPPPVEPLPGRDAPLPRLPVLPMLPAGVDREAFLRGLHYG